MILRVQLAKRLATVPELLPKTTLLLALVPDFQQTRKNWHESDLYQIWREPSVQAVCKNRSHGCRQDGERSQTLEEFLQLGPTHGFIALASLENNEPKLIGGFHFEPAPEKARKFIDATRGAMVPENGRAKRETIVYQQHKIETVSVSHFVFAERLDNHWFFGSNDPALLEGAARPGRPPPRGKARPR